MSPPGLESDTGAGMAVEVLTREERVARARLALAHAELRTGARSVHLQRAEAQQPEGQHVEARGAEARRPEVRWSESPRPRVPRQGGEPTLVEVSEPPVPEPSVSEAPVSATPVPDDLVLDRPAPERPGPDALPTALLTTERPPLPVPPALVPLLPDGLRRGATTAVVGSTSLAMAVLAGASASGAWAAVVGQPALGLLAAAESGVELSRLVVVPSPGADAALVLGALVDGMDVVVVGPHTTLTDADRRRLSARARERGAVLLATVAWPGADVVLTAGPVGGHGGWSGLGDGEGRLRTRRVNVVRTGRRGAAVPLTLEVDLPLTAPAGHPVDPARRGTPAVPVVAARPELRLVG
ncbi:hypothetical protein Celgi_1882 [Cellulomonas gilvus ATCC 13127]|uniref:Uncharacterized protein n=2 Tax=Cellulomonas gilvus TaxID=11 RepID=F8A7I3_CELGA|nr:hypothetical protein Celgi_1882 [Cellulomonas gilvus ATCC 13127]